MPGPVPQPGGQGEGVPPDLIPAYKASALLCCSTDTLRRWATEDPPKITAYRDPERTGYFYRRSECDEIRSRFRRVE